MVRSRIKSKIVAAVLGVTVVLAMAGGALAAWQVTRQQSTQAMVLGTMTLEGLECESQIEGEYAVCVVPVVNQFDEPIRITMVAGSSTDRPEAYMTSGEWKLDGVLGNSNQPSTLAPGPGEITFTWRPKVGAALGPITIQAEVAAESTS